jgi:hypothetical protein
MYNLLTTKELTTLQSMLFEATEAAFQAVTAKNEDPAWFARYRPLHRELGNLFIEAATELLLRVDQDVKAA